MITFLLLATATVLLSGTGEILNTAEKNYNLTSSTEILLTSEGGEKLSVIDNIVFSDVKTSANIIHVHPDNIKQTLHGIGTSFTESSAFVLAHLSEENEMK